MLLQLIRVGLVAWCGWRDAYDLFILLRGDGDADIFGLVAVDGAGIGVVGVMHMICSFCFGVMVMLMLICSMRVYIHLHVHVVNIQS